MSDTALTQSAEEVVEESVSHYRVQKMGDGSIRINTGGRVVGGETYWDALKRFAEWGQERLEDSPDHLREDREESIHWNTSNPETEDVVLSTDEDLKREAIDTILETEATEARAGAWLAKIGDTMVPGLGDEINVYRLWGTEYDESKDPNEW